MAKHPRFPDNSFFMHNNPGITATNISGWKARGWNIDNFDSNGMTPLMWAAHGGALETIKHLIAQGSAINTPSELAEAQKSSGILWHGLTAAMYAAKRGHAPCVEALIHAGADLALLDSLGNSALSFVAGTRCTSCVQLIQAHLLASDLNRTIDEPTSAHPALRI